jgi:uncharacterized membrane protein
MPVRLLFITICALIAVLSVPLALRLIKPNLIYGFRTPRTLSSPDIWYPANVFAGRALLLASVISGAGFWLAPAAILGRTETVLAILLVPIGSALAASLLYLRRFRP